MAQPEKPKRTDRREGTIYAGFHLPADMVKDVKRAAVELNLTFSAYVALALTERLTKDAKLIRRS